MSPTRLADNLSVRSSRVEQREVEGEGRCTSVERRVAMSDMYSHSSTRSMAAIDETWGVNETIARSSASGSNAPKPCSKHDCACKALDEAARTCSIAIIHGRPASREASWRIGRGVREATQKLLRIMEAVWRVHGRFVEGGSEDLLDRGG